MDDVADDIAGGGFGGDGFDVGAGELEAVEDDCRAFGLDEIASEGGDEEGDGGLDGFGVFQDGEVDFDGWDDGFEGGIAGADGRVAVDHGALALEEAEVEVAEVAGVEARGAATESVGLDVAAGSLLHDVLLRGTPSPRWGYFGLK